MVARTISGTSSVGYQPIGTFQPGEDLVRVYLFPYAGVDELAASGMFLQGIDGTPRLMLQMISRPFRGVGVASYRQLPGYANENVAVFWYESNLTWQALFTG